MSGRDLQQALNELRERYPRDRVVPGKGGILLYSREGPTVAPIRLVEYNGIKVTQRCRQCESPN